MDRALLLFCALALNIAAAGPRRWYEAMGLAEFTFVPALLLRKLEYKLNRERRSDSERQLRGTLLVIAALLVSMLVGWLCGAMFRGDLQFFELVIVAILLPVRPVWQRVSHIRKALQSGDLALARQALAGTPWRHAALLDEYGLARAAIELLSVSFSEKIIAPLAWYLIAGLPGFFACKSITLMQDVIAPSVHGAQPFAKATSAVHALMHYVPSRISALFWIVACFFLTSKTTGKTIRRISAGMFVESPQALELIAPSAVLGVSLGGTASVYAAQWIGDGIARVGSGDIKRALYGYALMMMMLFILLGCLF